MILNESGEVMHRCYLEMVFVLVRLAMYCMLHFSFINIVTFFFLIFM